MVVQPSPSVLVPRMRILFLTQYFPPETGAAQNRLSDLAKRLVEAGHRVTVLTALPSYPKGDIFEGYRSRFIMTEEDRGIRIVRTWVYATLKKSFVPRILNYLSFAVLSVVVGWLAVENADVVFVESPPLFLGFSGYLLSKLKHARFVLNVSDLWPESAVVLGVLHSRCLIRWATRLEEWQYRNATLVTGQTQGIVDSIRKRSAATPTHLLTNGVAPEFLKQVNCARLLREHIRRKFGFGEKFIIAYTGVHGLAQGLDTLLRSAEILREHKSIRFCFFGDGPEKPHLQAIVRERGLDSVEFHAPIPASQMAELLASIDVSVVPLKGNDLFKGALPSKLFEALGAGVPVVVALEGEAKKLVETSQSGLLVKPENPEDMAQQILRLYQDSELCKRLGNNGQMFVHAHYNRKEIAEKFERLMLAVNYLDSAELIARLAEDRPDVGACHPARDSYLCTFETNKKL
jgi:glycosyltransferase involved in cell wall biosynthesis